MILQLQMKTTGVREERSNMETRIALIGIIVENPESIEALNHLLHEYGKYIIGRWESHTESVRSILSAWQLMRRRM